MWFFIITSLQTIYAAFRQIPFVASQKIPPHDRLTFSIRPEFLLGTRTAGVGGAISIGFLRNSGLYLGLELRGGWRNV
ncbi:MAG: hypothetical protein FWE23_09240 [Chitinivibrionia bacterium]|nr:hypothetical protein [Chitinivibrionia bacterium]